MQVLRLCVSPSRRYSSKCFAGRPIYSVNIWKLLWLSRPLIICTEQISIYINTFPNAITSKKATNHEIGVYFLTNAIVALCHAPP